MSEADIEIDLTTTNQDSANEQRDLTDREKNLTKTFGYQKVVVQPSQILGTGSYGNVVKAMLDGLPCAAKILHHTFFTSHDPDVVNFTQRFQLECRILHHLRHPSIVQFLGVVDDPRPQSNRRPILLMELMEESLTHFLESEQKSLLYHIQVNITYDIALALDYLHANGIQHRDLSSNNILLVAGTRAKLTDFGVSKMVEINPRMSQARNKYTTCPGTLAYMPPEALLPGHMYGDKVDVFSTGVLMVQIVTRKYPNPGDAHRTERDHKQRRVLVPIPELERRKGDLLGLLLTHPLRPIALECLKDEEGDRPTATNLCQVLVRLKSAPEYTTSLEEYRQQVIALPPTKSACDMRDTEIAVLDGEIESLTQRSKTRGIFQKRDKSKLDTDIADLHHRKQPLVAERECQLEEEQKKMEYENENAQLKKRVERLEMEKADVLLENAELKKNNEKLVEENKAMMSEISELHMKMAELKQILQTQLLVQRNVQDEQNSKGGDNAAEEKYPSQRKLQVCM